MLARRSTLEVHNRVLGETPLLVPAFSSRGTPDVAGILKTMEEFITETILVSAYDVYHGNLGDQLDLTFAGLIFLDSGGYEKANRTDLSDLHHSQPCSDEWTREIFAAALDAWPVGPQDPATVAVSYDVPNKPLADQIAVAMDLLGGRGGLLKELIVKPETPGQCYVQLSGIEANAKHLGDFDVVGFTEPELGNSILHRMEMIARTREIMDGAGVDTPLHVFGGLDPISTPLYYVAGAEIFDGLSWLRLAYLNGVAMYRRNYGALDLGIAELDTHVDRKLWSRNLSLMAELRLEMLAFHNEQDFDRFSSNCDLIERSYHQLCGALGREI